MKTCPTKIVRDLAKSRYSTASSCHICSSRDSLEFHHYSTLAVLVGRFTGTALEFIAAHPYELFEDTVTLCRTHHRQLHSIYGRDPALHTASKQRRWVEIQHAKVVQNQESS